MPSMWEAVGRLADVGQRLLADRLELMRLETRDDLLVVSRNLVLVLSLLPILLAGWLALMAGLVIALLPVLPPAAALCILGALHVVAGGAGVYWASTRLKKRRVAEQGGEAVERTEVPDSSAKSSGGEQSGE